MSKIRKYKIIKYTIIVLSILLLLVFLSVPLFVPRNESAKSYYGMLVLIDTLEKYHAEFGGYPSTSDGLEILNMEVNGQPYSGVDSFDRWGVPYYYNSPGIHNPSHYDLWTYGADKLEGGEGADGDIYNWEGEGKGLLLRNEKTNRLLFISNRNVLVPDNVWSVVERNNYKQ